MAAAPEQAPLTLTPMLRQYAQVKAAHPDAILLFRLGESRGKTHGLCHRPHASAPWRRASPSLALAPRGWQQP